MFGWLRQRAELKASESDARIFEQFNAILRGMSDKAMGMTLAQAFHWAGTLKSKHGWDLEHPTPLDIGASSELGTLARNTQQYQAKQILGLRVWMHSHRALTAAEFQPHGAAMWAELLRGWPHAEVGVLMLEGLGIKTDRTCWGKFPIKLVDRQHPVWNSAPPPRLQRADPAARHARLEPVLGYLRLQLSLAEKNGGRPPTDDFSAGYVLGAVDASLQAMRRIVEADALPVDAFNIVFNELFGADRGQQLHDVALNGKVWRLTQVNLGIANGNLDWMNKTSSNTMPLGLAEHCINEASRH